MMCRWVGAPLREVKSGKGREEKGRMREREREGVGGEMRGVEGKSSGLVMYGVS